MLSKTRAALAVAFLLPLLHGCGLDDANDGKVRVLNATTEYTTVDLYDVNSKNDSNDLIAGTASGQVSGYANLQQGSYTFNIIGSGGSSAAASVAGSVSSSDHYLVIASITGGQAQMQFLSEEEDAPNSGNAKLRLYNAAASDSGAVDVYVTSHDCTALQTTDTALATGVSGLQSSFSQILASAAGQQWNICVTANGDKTTLLLAAQSTFTDQQVSTLVLTHTSGGTLLNGFLVNQQGAVTPFNNSLARVRVVADAASGADVGATVAGVQFSTTASPSVGNYVAVPTAASGPVVTSLSIGGTALADPGLTLTAGADYTLLVAGTAGAATIALLPDNNTASLSSSLPVRMRLVNGINGFSSPVSLTSDGTSVADSVTFGTASAYANIAASSSSGTSDVEALSGGATLWSSTTTSLSSGSVYSVFLLGDYTPANSPPVFGSIRQDHAPSAVVAASSASTSTTTGN
jgi:hypothetical protein